jgi:hypothetical protein
LLASRLHVRKSLGALARAQRPALAAPQLAHSMFSFPVFKLESCIDVMRKPAAFNLNGFAGQQIYF